MNIIYTIIGIVVGIIGSIFVIKKFVHVRGRNDKVFDFFKRYDEMKDKVEEEYNKKLQKLDKEKRNGKKMSDRDIADDIIKHLRKRD